MDKLPIETSHILANTKGQPLSQHLFAVGYLAKTLIEKMGVNQKKLAQACFVAGILHDIGKIDPQFQAWLLKKLGKLSDDEKDESPLPDDGVHIDGTVRGSAKFSFETHPRHQEISWLWAESLLVDDHSLNSRQKQQLLHGVYWHHTRPYRKDDKYFSKAKGIHKLLDKSLTDTNMENLYEQVIAVLNDVKNIANHFDESKLKDFIPKFNNCYTITNNDLPLYKIYDDLLEETEEYLEGINKNALNNLVRTAVVSADRIVSAMTSDDLAEYLAEGTLVNALDTLTLEDSQLSDHITKCLQGFENTYPNSERNQAQSKAANELAKLRKIAEFDEVSNIGVLQGPAGCGKTKITLEWAHETDAKQIIWVCPRVQVCLGLVHDLTHTDYLPNAKIEILTGEHKKTLTGGVSLEDAPETPENEYFSGDIVITTIDQIINNIISHTKVDGLVDFMQAHVVFDEFHELIPMPAFNLLFAELIEVKKLRQHQANTLLVSATPHDLFVTELLNLPSENMVRIDSFNQSRYRIKFETYDDKEEASPLITTAYTDGKKTFVITNTAQDAQQAFIRHQSDENNVLLHSKYTKADKTEWFNKVFECFKRDGTGHYDVLRSGPIVQASLNISCDRMITELTNAENWLQRLGRLDRFGLNDEVNHYTTVIPQSSESGKQNSNTAKFLNSLCSWQSTHAWMMFLKDKLEENNTVTLNQLYSIYKDFYIDESSQNKIREDIQKALRESVMLINNKVIDPLCFPPKSKLKGSIAKMSKNSLRGNNCCVQMAVCQVDNQFNSTFVNEYAYDENTDHSQVTVGLTESTDKVQGGAFEMRKSEQDLVSFMKKKHHNVMQAKYPDETFKASKYDWELLKQARSPEHPIYVSYTPQDLEPVGGTPHPYAIYYVKTDKQPVGAMQILSDES